MKATSALELYYDSASRGSPPLEELREVIHYRNLILQLTRRDVMTRYKRSVLGIAWTMLNPLGMMVVLTIAFSHIFRFETEYGYPAYVLSGLLAWNFFSQTTTAAMVNLVWGGGLLHRIYIPRTSFALAAIATGLVNLTLALIPLVFINLITGVPIRAAILFLPIPMLLIAAFALGVGLLISTFAVYYPDVAEMYGIALYGWMYLTPVIYPVNILPESIRFWITLLNPMYYFLEIYRAPIYYGRLPTLDLLIPAIIIALVTLLVGWIVFTNKSDEFSYRI
ncbi:ABC-type polysaccharide/polyol phosphate export system, permease component [Bellilinea caldifistulae]|uniref:ABC transporter permease n=1 Tax=Bellilinea caldifistulae TaxID=360411 RepID=UPI0009E4FA7D|nr:ABC transporter permease [Bellilinea caldifistulae]GAP09606.1 ABC-type polysaccharide/polyol phosphate export system, permease component [Bellilinea caldifistulae]